MTTTPNYEWNVADKGRSTASLLKEVALSPEHQRAWTQTKAAMLHTAPFFASLLYQMMNPRGTEHVALFTEDPQIPIAATDGVNLILRPSTFFAMNIHERVFVICHEIAHGMWAHCELLQSYVKRGGVPFANKLLKLSSKMHNFAADYVINDMLIESQVGKFPSGCLHDTSIAKGGDAVIDAYAKLYKKYPPQKGGQPGDGMPGGGFDVLLDPSGATDAGKSGGKGRDDGEWKAAIAAAANAAQAQGKLPAGIKRVLGELMEPKVSWQEHILSLMQRKMGGGGYDWRRPDRRMITRNPDPIFAPASSGFGANLVAIGIDTSGSCWGMIETFLSEVSGILEDVRPRRIVVFWCDAEVGKVNEIEDSQDLAVVRAEPAPGGGGTSFVPVFDELDNLGVTPDTLVYLTDGYGTFPEKAPSYPTIWASVGLKKEQYPFGDVVEIPVV
ncbi:MAG TPA: VWA-like domain-containing protein [Ktedonobacterales bacterium]|nr:VWA-like domain-containing protein [Ktedonobacterales bacterium]